MTQNGQSATAEVCLVQEHQGGEATLKLAFGILALLSALWLLAVDSRPVPRITAGLGALFGVLWVSRYLRRRTTRTKDCLVLNAHGLHLRCNGQNAVDVPWDTVERVELDEDALVVCVIRRDGPEVRLDPGFGGLPLRALGETIHGALVKHRACIPKSDG